MAKMTDKQREGLSLLVRRGIVRTGGTASDGAGVVHWKVGEWLRENGYARVPAHSTVLELTDAGRKAWDREVAA